MTYRTLIKAALASSVMLFAGTSIAMGRGGNCGSGGGCGEGQAKAGGDCQISGLLNSPVIELTSESATTLLQMREEEKLARDVYAALGDKWGAKVFNITNAEQKHMNAMKKMLDRFGMEDPITDDTRGVFQSQAFTDLYDQLIKSGSESLLEALKVGAKIEELDLSDIQTAADGVADPVLTKVYGNLTRATRNHLRAFAAQIDLAGSTYTAEHLTQEEFDTIAASDFEKGMGNGKGKGMGQGKGQGKNANKDCGLCSG
ncbi:MAG: DUF2202 domain-containing protein [Phycisphaerales bacterium]|nr:DUF2202 domain-containing protein [Phycisphaerales bacterium]